MENQYNIEYLQAEEILQLMKVEEVIFLDIRNVEEYKVEHIKGAVCIPILELEKKESNLLDKNKKIVVYCNYGIRSKVGCEILKRKGYKTINMQGGILKWKGALEN
ncbi:rhodanese-related sulfurtransferase [Natranaerovirga hydrolytica]|uniref:Rhodanese-related sulfurtransferase n=1 Tax=Natranaerovirga hydrolytica TaxID=680378 RepID=A0A4R1MD99_9FIRM|nr:rhodanese-like domain-containing protein [Natranaerovirga hydrolytica]TCK90488.1 rhodanese-related sulfurtransferase [Natranaerovirga hydrolytica]